jgi:hypothetical protein
MLKFDEVVKCKNVAELNLFIEQYLAERNIVVPSEEANRYYWALVYRWKSSLKKLDEA